MNDITDSNTTIVLPPHFDTYIQTQCNSDSDDSAGAKYASLAGLDQIMNHHCITDSNNKEDSKSYEKPH